MKKIAIASIITLFLAFMCAFVAGTVSAQKGWEKTVTLQSGEVVLDMRGEWDFLFEAYERFKWYGEPKPCILLITQEGNKFSAVQQTDMKMTLKGTELIKGELDKDGFKAVQIWRGDAAGGMKWDPFKGEISEDGNKVVLDDGVKTKATLTRR